MKTHCCSVSISKTAALLPNAAKSQIKDHFFGHMLRNLSDKLTSRSLQIMLVKTTQAEDKKVIKWTMDNKTWELTKSGVLHIMCVLVTQMAPFWISSPRVSPSPCAAGVAGVGVGVAGVQQAHA